MKKLYALAEPEDPGYAEVCTTCAAITLNFHPHM